MALAVCVSGEGLREMDDNYGLLGERRAFVVRVKVG